MLMLLSVVTVVGSMEVFSAEAADAVTLKFMRPGRFDVVERVFRPIVGAFEKENPNIKVEFVDMGWDEYFKRLPIMLSSRTTPDVMLNQQGGIYQYAAENQFLALDKFLDVDRSRPAVTGSPLQ